MRENAKYVFYILAIAFVGWMVFDVGMGVTGQQFGPSDVVLKVNGEAVHLPEYNQAVTNASEQYRQQSGAAPLTREDQRALENEVVDQLIQERLLRRAYRKLGIRVTAQELIDAARTSPLPELMNHPDLQTDGRFDPEKYQRLLSSNADPQLLAYIEARYRDQIPQYKLAMYLTADVYVPDAKLWRIYRDQHDSVTAAVVAMRPETVSDSAVPVSEAELEQYLRRHEADFTRPAVAHLSFVAQPRRPDASDTAAARARVAELRTEVAGASAEKFADVARRESADTGSGRQGGDLGWFSRATPPFVAPFAEAVKRMRLSQLSEPVLTQFGYHLIRLTDAKGDSLRASHILVPIELAGVHRDTVEARADTLDRVAAEQATGALLDTVAVRLGLPVGMAPPLTEGSRVQLGRFVIPDAGVWAFEAQPGETSPVIEAEPAYYVFRLDSLSPSGVPPLAEIRPTLLDAVRLEKKRDLLRQRAAEAAVRLRAAPDFRAAARELGYPVQIYGPMPRLNPPLALRGEPLVLGAAFGLGVGQRSALISGVNGFYVVETLARRAADSTAWLTQRDTQREQLVAAARQARMQLFLRDLREGADITDRRKELFRTSAQAGTAGP